MQRLHNNPQPLRTANDAAYAWRQMGQRGDRGPVLGWTSGRHWILGPADPAAR